MVGRRRSRRAGQPGSLLRGLSRAARQRNDRAAAAAGRRCRRQCRGGAAGDRQGPLFACGRLVCAPGAPGRGPAGPCGGAPIRHACDSRTADHGGQRRPHLRGRAVDAGALPRVEAHRHRAGDERPHRRCHGRGAAARPVSGQAGVPSNLHQHAGTPREPLAAAAPSGSHRGRSRRRGQSSRRRSDGHGPSGGDRLGAARRGRSRRARLLHPRHHAHRQRRDGHQRRGIGAADRARRARGQRAAQ